MKVYLNRMSGIEEAITAMFVSKRNWSRELELHVFDVCSKVLDRYGNYNISDEASQSDIDEFNSWIERLAKWGWRHTTLLRFIDFSISVEGLHRAGQDDWDSHAKRFNNRIIRSSTRLAKFDYEMSDWYKGKIIPTDVALAMLNITTPDEIEVDGKKYVKTVNGYILKEMENVSDVKRGLYMLSIPSNFVFKVDLTEWSHVYKERNKNGTANPEVKQLCEEIADQMERMIPIFNRELFEKVKN